MDMNWLEGIVYAFVSGFAQFMPVSAQAHEQILLRLFGADKAHSLMQLFVHIGALAALILSSKNQLNRIIRENSLKKIPKRRRKRQPDPQTILDLSFVKTACIPLLLGYLLYFKTAQWENKLPLSAVFLVLNGLVLHIPMYLSMGNKDSRSMSRLDALLFGIGGITGILPGMSRVGVTTSIAITRGADTQQAYKWSLLLSLPALAAWILFDVISLFAASFTGMGFLFVLQCILSAGAAYLGTASAIYFMRFITVKAGLYNFSYYCWGAALFAFILYLYT